MEIRHGIFGGLIFVQGIFGSYAGSPREFLGFDICLHSLITITGNPEYSLGWGQKEKKGKLRAIIPSPDSCFHITCTRRSIFSWTPGKLFKRQTRLYTRWIITIQWLKLCFRITNYIIHCIDVFSLLIPLIL